MCLNRTIIRLDTLWTIFLFVCNIHVREQNFGRPSMIQQNHTSLNKGYLGGPDRRAGVLNQWCGTSLNTNIGSIGVPRAHLRAHMHRAMLARTPAQWSGKLETLKHLSDRRTTGTWTFVRMCALCPIKPSFGSRYRCLPPKVFSKKIFNRTFLLIL